MNKIEYTKNPATSDIDFLTKQINQETSEYGEAYPFAFFMRDDDSKIIAGANGFVIYGAIYTDQLWVDKDYRGQGFAKKLWIKYMNLAS
jgi:GNAT superfamily N-acetyltransferase